MHVVHVHVCTLGLQINLEIVKSSQLGNCVNVAQIGFLFV